MKNKLRNMDCNHSRRVFPDERAAYCKFIAVGWVEFGGYTVGTGSGS